MKLLLVEDNLSLSEALIPFLEKNYYTCEQCTTANEALILLESSVFDLLLLDINLEESSGYDVITALRKQKKHIPILVISSMSEVDNRIKGLTLGADDYLTKPFDNRELLARIESLLRRHLPVTNHHLQFKSLSLNLESGCAHREGTIIELRKKEFLLLEYLIINQGMILSRNKLLDRVWGTEVDIDSNKVDVHIKNLRKKIDLPFDEGYIKTIRGLGYVLR